MHELIETLLIDRLGQVINVENVTQSSSIW